MEMIRKPFESVTLTDFQHRFFDLRTSVFNEKATWLEHIVLDPQQILANNKECRSLRLNFGRGTGNTFWIAHTAVRLMLGGESSLIVAPTRYILQKLNRICIDVVAPQLCLKDRNLNEHVYDENSFLRRGDVCIDLRLATIREDNLRGFSVSHVFFDASDMMSAHSVDKFLRMLPSVKQFVFC